MWAVVSSSCYPSWSSYCCWNNTLVIWGCLAFSVGGFSEKSRIRVFYFCPTYRAYRTGWRGPRHSWGFWFRHHQAQFILFPVISVPAYGMPSHWNHPKKWKKKKKNEIWRTCPLYCHTTRHTHTHAHAGWWKVLSAFSHPGILPQGHPGAVGGQRCSARGPSPSARSWLGQGQDRWASAFFACFLLLGFYGGNPGNTGRTCKLHTERPGNKPRHVAPCGTWTHNLLAVRQQCYALCHRALGGELEQTVPSWGFKEVRCTYRTWPGLSTGAMA